MKKFTVFLLTFCVLLSLGLSAYAEGKRSETNVIVINDCEKAFGSFALERDDPAEGDACAAYRIKANSFVCAYNFDEVDASECDAVALEIYVSDKDLISSFSQLYFELTSSGKCDDEELAWPLAGLLPGHLEEGWNTVYLLFSDATPTGEIDLSCVDFIRIFALDIDTASCAGEEIRFDNIRLAYLGGYDYSGMKIAGRTGDKKNENIEIPGKSEPDPEARVPAAPAAETQSGDEKGPEEEEPEGLSLPAILGIGGAAAVLIAGAAVLFVKKKKKA